MTVLTQPPLVGSYIPSIDLVSPDGKPSTLAAQLTERGGIMYFMRTATCPVCNAHVKNLARLSSNNRLYGFKPIIVVPGTPKDANKVALRHGTAHVSIWSSENGHETFGLHVKVGMIQQSGTWVVDGEGGILHTTTSTIPMQGLNHQAVRETAAVLAGRDPSYDVAQEVTGATQATPGQSPYAAPESSSPTPTPASTPTIEDAIAPAVEPRPVPRVPAALPVQDATPRLAPEEPVTLDGASADTTLGRIVGVDLRAVAFARDYVQLVFGSTTVSCFDWPSVRTANGMFDVGDPGYRDALCSYIGSAPSDARVSGAEGLVIRLGDAVISIEAAAEQTAATSAMVVDLAEGVNAVWRAGAEAFQPTR